jgi:hypothetical protein
MYRTYKWRIPCVVNTNIVANAVSLRILMSVSLSSGIAHIALAHDRREPVLCHFLSFASSCKPFLP